jgi:hypothetical protein
MWEPGWHVLEGCIEAGSPFPPGYSIFSKRLSVIWTDATKVYLLKDVEKECSMDHAGWAAGEF